MARKKHQKSKVPRKPRKGRVPEQAITRRGRRIYAEGQIRTLTGNIWGVASQGTEGRWYRVSLACGRPTCECAYHTTGKGCKGMAAVECLVLAEDESPRAGKMVIGETNLECPKCHRSTCGNGRDRCKSGERQRYLCGGCGRRFGGPPGL